MYLQQGLFLTGQVAALVLMGQDDVVDVLLIVDDEELLVVEDEELLCVDDASLVIADVTRQEQAEERREGELAQEGGVALALIGYHGPKTIVPVAGGRCQAGKKEEGSEEQEGDAVQGRHACNTEDKSSFSAVNTVLAEEEQLGLLISR
ncbi:hypothetical protein G7Y79_00005g016120 [Physcia stellaris]|nr:hypothetical protein G7Y79_00005g016120 [Physcia stellaris]